MKHHLLEKALSSARINTDLKTNVLREKIARHMRYLMWYEIKLEILDMSMEVVEQSLGLMGFEIKALVPKYWDNGGAIEEDITELRKGLPVRLDLIPADSRFPLNFDDVYRLMSTERGKMERIFSNHTSLDLKFKLPLDDKIWPIQAFITI